MNKNTETYRRWVAKNPNYRKEWFAKNPGKAREYYERHKAKHNEARQKRRAADPHNAERKRREYLSAKYGITLEQYAEMLLAQDGRCAGCKTVLLKRRHIDHCHTTGRVRGILCHHCNVALGHCRDDPAVLQSLIEYLKNTL